MAALRRFILFYLALFSLAIPLMGASAEEIIGCSCPGGGGGNQIPGGGAIAASATYALDRAGLGTSWNDMNSSKGNYRVSATLGGFVSQGRTTSATYLVHHPLSLEVITDSAGLTLEPVEFGEFGEDPPEEPLEPEEPSEIP